MYVIICQMVEERKQSGSGIAALLRLPVDQRQGAFFPRRGSDGQEARDGFLVTNVSGKGGAVFLYTKVTRVPTNSHQEK